MILPGQSGATISECQRYRYSLWRRWSTDPMMTYCMLNPSTADASANDPTITRCSTRAKLLGFGGIYVVNLFALRSTDPRALYLQPEPVGPENNEQILKAAETSNLFICGWGVHGKFKGRDQVVHGMLRAFGVTPHVLKMNKDGSPGHPLYVSYKVKPGPWGAME